MNWSNVKLIWLREVRDQLRDRRTLFMVAVLPLLLYPLLGMSFVQVSQFLQGHPAKVILVGLDQPAEFPPLVETDKAAGQEQPRFVAKLLPGGEAAGKLFDLQTMSREDFAKLGVDLSKDPAAEMADIRELLREKGWSAVVYFPAEFWTKLAAFRKAVVEGAGKARDTSSPDPKPTADEEKALEVPAPELFSSSVREESQPAMVRLRQTLANWRNEIGAQNLRELHVPTTTAAPFTLNEQDTAEPEQRNAMLWSKILPFVLLIWALTGAFYPAIDLCAGEKERGTLETLLCSPAERSEIVAGKLLAIMLFSIATALLNMMSLGATGLMVMHQVTTLSASFGSHVALGGPPPLLSLLWLLVALVPTSALFSALCLALASFARSTKEGQYYLMPLVLVSMPLMILPMSPGVELNFGNALIPLTGLMLLLKMLLEGNVWQALPFVPVVAGVTLVCCRIAMGWAVDQFNRESVLFRESERFDLRLWLTHLWRDRKDTPSVGAAVCCGVAILMVQFFVGLLLVPTPQPTFADTAQLFLLSQVVPILAPVLLMTIYLTRRPAQTLLLKAPRPSAAAAALALALVIWPLSLLLHDGLARLYPAGDAAKEMDKYVRALGQAPNWWLPILLIAVLPAICEELAFRGFILSGLRHSGRRWRAILISSAFFGITHQVLQQSVGAFLLGIILAYIAIQSGSLIPGMIFHITYNSTIWIYSTRGQQLQKLIDEHPGWTGVVLATCGLISASLLWWFSRLRYDRTQEETLQEAIETGAPTPEALESIAK